MHQINNNEKKRNRTILYNIKIETFAVTQAAAAAVAAARVKYLMAFFPFRYNFTLNIL